VPLHWPPLPFVGSYCGVIATFLEYPLKYDLKYYLKHNAMVVSFYTYLVCVSVLGLLSGFAFLVEFK